MLLDLPSEIIIAIYEWLNRNEQWQMIMSNKTIQQDLHQHQYFQLNYEMSIMYVFDDDFRNNIQSRIPNTSQQLSLDLSSTPTISDHHLHKVANVHALNLSQCFRIKNVSVLERVHELSLAHCDQVTDVSALGNVRILNLSLCSNIWDVSALGNVHTLDLSFCSNIWDVSALGNVHTLILTSCENIEDVSALGNVHTLNLSYCYGILDVSALKNVHTLDLTGCYNIHDVAALQNVSFLYLTLRPITIKGVDKLHTTHIYFSGEEVDV